MPRLTPQTAVFALEIQQLIASWCRELDMAGGADIAAFCTEDVLYRLGGTPHRGHAAVRTFYAARNERVRAQQRDGVRTQRHSISNILIDFPQPDTASAAFTLVNYSAEGKAPARDLVGPTIVADCRMDFLCGADGEWRIALFDSAPVFIGNDPFLNAAVVRP